MSEAIFPDRPRVRALVWQARPGRAVTAEELARLDALRPDLVVLPEYFWVRAEDAGPAATADHAAEDLARLAALSERVDAVWVGGTLVERAGDGRLHNSAPVFDRGQEVARYRKRRLMPGEAAAGLVPGHEPVVVTVRGWRLGLLVCADVLDPAAYDDLAPLRPDLVAVPTHSPLRPVDPPGEKLARDQAYFEAGARRTGAWVLKACTVGGVYGRRAQGRSLIAGPAGVLRRVEPAGEAEERWLSADLEIAPRA